MQQIKYKPFAGIRKIGFDYNNKIKKWAVITPTTGKNIQNILFRKHKYFLSLG